MALKGIQTGEFSQQFMQDASTQALTPLQSSPLVYGSLLMSKQITAGVDNLIEHKLQKPVRYWILAGIDTDSRVWSPVSGSLSNSSTDDKFINIWCSATCIINLWVT